MRVIVRRERPHPGAQLSLFEEADGWRYRAFVTNTTTVLGPLAFLEARHRAHARVEDRIRNAKDAGLGRVPSRRFAINSAWLLLTVSRRPGGLDPNARPHRRRPAPPLASCEPKALRYRFLHVPARLTRGGRRRRLRTPATWPWPAATVAVIANIAAIPQHRWPPSAHEFTTQRPAPGSATRHPVMPARQILDLNDNHALVDRTSPTL